MPRERPLPLPMREVAERSEDGEGTGTKPSQSPAVTAPPKGEPRRSMLEREMERIGTDTLHSLFYDHPINAYRVFSATAA